MAVLRMILYTLYKHTHNSGSIPAHWTPASSKCPQNLRPEALLGQSRMCSSVPRHWTLSRYRGPVPCPKNALVRAVPSERTQEGIVRVRACACVCVYICLVHGCYVCACAHLCVGERLPLERELNNITTNTLRYTYTHRGTYITSTHQAYVHTYIIRFHVCVLS